MTQPSLDHVAQCWNVLVETAERHRTITYGEAAVKIGGIARGMGAFLRPIQSFCHDHGLPNLSVLVVKSDTRKQGSGFDGDPQREMALVLACDWKSVGNPFAGGKSK